MALRHGNASCGANTTLKDFFADHFQILRNSRGESVGEMHSLESNLVSMPQCSAAVPVSLSQCDIYVQRTDVP